MKLTYTVQNRTLTCEGDIRVVAKDTLYLTFNFVEGYGWEDLDIVANVSCSTNTSQIRNIKNGMTYKVPTSMLAKPGVIFVSLMGISNGQIVANTLTSAITVEYADLNVLNTNGYASTSTTCACNSDYNGYINAANDAANRAELAAQSVEGLAVGWYTKAECDEKFAKRANFKAKVGLPFSTNVLTPGVTPRLTVYAEPPQDLQGTWESPALLKCIEGVKVKLTSDVTNTSSSYSNFKLRRLGNSVADKLIIDAKGARVESNIHELKVGSVPGSWVNSSTYTLSLATSPLLDTTYADVIITSVTGITVEAEFNSLTLKFTTIPTNRQLKELIIWYPTGSTTTTIVSTSGIGGVPEEEALLTVDKVVNTVSSALASVDVEAEMSITKYLAEYTQINQQLIARVDEVEENIEEANQAVAKCAQLEAKVTEIVDDVDTATNAVTSMTVDVNALKTRTTTVEADIVALKAADTALAARITNSGTDIDLIKANITKLTTDYTELEQTALSHHTRLATIDTKVAALETSTTQLTTDTAQAVATANAAKTTAEGVDAKAESAVTTANSVRGIADEAKTIAQGIEAKADSAIDVANEAKDVVDEAKEIAAQAKEIAEGINDQVLAANTKADLANSKSDIANTKSDLANTKSDAANTKADTVATRMDNIIGRIETLESQVASLLARVAELEKPAIDPETGTVGYTDGDGNIIVDGTTGQPLHTTQIVQNLVKEVLQIANDDKDTTSGLVLDIID